MKKKKIVWIVLVLAAALVIGGGMLLGQEGHGAYIQTQVETGDISTTYSFTGSIVAPRSQTVVSMTADKVKDVYVEANQKVEEGERLFRLFTGETIKADIDGEVVSLDVRENDMIAAGDLLAVIMDTENMEAEISVDEYDVAAIELGREVTVTVNALDADCMGRVKSFGKQGMVMGTMAAYKAGIEFDVPEKALPGMQVEVKMINESAENAMLLKVAALQFDEQNRAYVLTKDEEGEYVQTYVTTGINDGSTVQIVSGLQSGQTVYYPAGIDIEALMKAMRSGM